MMTPEQSREWFEIMEATVIHQQFTGASTDIERMYQAFAARIFQDFKRESVCNCLINVPDEVGK